MLDHPVFDISMNTYNPLRGGRNRTYSMLFFTGKTPLQDKIFYKGY